MSLCCKIRINRIAAAELGVFFLSFGCLSIFCEHGQVGPLSYIIYHALFRQERYMFVARVLGVMVSYLGKNRY